MQKNNIRELESSSEQLSAFSFQLSAISFLKGIFPEFVAIPVNIGWCRKIIFVIWHRAASHELRAASQVKRATRLQNWSKWNPLEAHSQHVPAYCKGLLIAKARNCWRSQLNSHWTHIELTLNSHWTVIWLTLNSYWTHIELPLDSHWTPIGLLLNSYWTHIELTLNSHWTHIGLPLDSYWTHIELTLNSHWTHIELTLNSHWYKVHTNPKP